MLTQTVDEFAASMDRIGESLGRDNTDGLKYCAEIVRKKVADNFNQGATATGSPWPAHAPATVARYGPHPLLILTGKMSQAAVLDGASGHVERIDGNSLDFGLSLDVIPYGRVHQEGFPEGSIPQREYLAVGTDELDDMGDALAEFGLDAFNQ